ncbi:hypothetical protein F4859DRAFT_477287 [Xylaria cf. heliscus]|nr:hypothetical protein F4859DRAFT_477287 [Xylaria cf. heliscus]
MLNHPVLPLRFQSCLPITPPSPLSSLFSSKSTLPYTINMQFSFTTILAALAMATVTNAQACVYIESLGGACNGYFPLKCQVQESPFPGTGKVTKCCVQGTSCSS